MNPRRRVGWDDGAGGSGSGRTAGCRDWLLRCRGWLLRCEQPLDEPRVVAPEHSRERGVQLLLRRRQAGQVEVDPAHQLVGLGVRTRLESVELEGSDDEGIDRGPGPLRVAVGRRLDLADRLEGPVPAPNVQGPPNGQAKAPAPTLMTWLLQPVTDDHDNRHVYDNPKSMLASLSTF